MVRRSATLVLMLFFCTQLHAVVHHHNDLEDHPDCAVCAVAHHQSADNVLPILFVFPAPLFEQTKVCTQTILLTSAVYQTHSGRAPPQFL